MTNEPEKPYINLPIYRDRKSTMTQFNAKKPLLVKKMACWLVLLTHFILTFLICVVCMCQMNFVLYTKWSKRTWWYC